MSGAKFSVKTDKISQTQYQSLLTILTTEKEDFTDYICVAKNDLGEDNLKISLGYTSHPSAPTHLDFVNASHNSITIKWKGGFDGGAKQWFQVRYNEVGHPGYKYEDVIPKEPTTELHTIRGEL